jgi:phage-related holin
MKNIIQEVLQKIDVVKVLHSICDKGLEKLAVSALAASFLDVLTVFAAFLFLFVVDVITRLMSQAHALWVAMYGKEFTAQYGNAYNYIRYIDSAHKWRFVNSWALRTGFVSKAFTYMLLLSCAAVCDSVIPVRAMFALVTTFLAVTELLSICENLGECEVSAARGLWELIKKRKDAIK